MPRKQNGFEEGKIYHVSNIGNTGEDIFLTDRNYEYFLLKLHLRVRGIFDIIGYSLISNQYHLVLKVKAERYLVAEYALRKRIPAHKLDLDKEEISLFLSQEMGNLLNAYAKAFNKAHGRKGSLFRENFRKKPLKLDEIEDLLFDLRYITDSQGLCDRMEKLKYSSHYELETGCRKIIDWLKYKKYYRRSKGNLEQEVTRGKKPENILLV